MGDSGFIHEGLQLSYYSILYIFILFYILPISGDTDCNYKKLLEKLLEKKLSDYLVNQEDQDDQDKLESSDDQDLDENSESDSDYDPEEQESSEEQEDLECSDDHDSSDDPESSEEQEEQEDQENQEQELKQQQEQINITISYPAITTILLLNILNNLFILFYLSSRD